MASTPRRNPSALDAITIVAATLVSFVSAGPARVLALLALALCLVLLGIRLRVFARAVRWFSRSAPRVALLAGSVALVGAALASWNASSRLERLPFEAPSVSHLPEATRACLEKPEVEAYLRELHGSLMRSWTQPPGMPAGAQQVVIEFTLLPSGEALNPRILASSFQGLGRSAREALARGTPFEPLPLEADCLSGAPVRLSLSNPLE